MNTVIEITNRGPLHKGNRKLDARNATQALRCAERKAPNLARAADELFKATLRREKAAQPAPVPAVSDEPVSILAALKASLALPPLV